MEGLEERKTEQIRESLSNQIGESRSDQTDLRIMLRLEQSGVKASGEKRGRLERSENITERENIRAKIEN